MSDRDKQDLKKALEEAEISDAELESVSGGMMDSCIFSCTSCDAACSPGCQPGSVRGTELA
jgi:hypothetical protein